jgi:endogenous inhibitor of DNA gyrase (YacG/DUF329 family)
MSCCPCDCPSSGPPFPGIYFSPGRWPMATRHCAACQQAFVPCRHVPAQRYCSARVCQKVRRRRWQQGKLKSDPDDLDNQARAQRGWRERHPLYWKHYRQTPPDYTARNQAQQRQRNRKRRPPAPSTMAKMDVLPLVTDKISGTYWLVPVNTSEMANMDAYMVELAVVSTG